MWDSALCAADWRSPLTSGRFLPQRTTVNGKANPWHRPAAVGQLLPFVHPVSGHRRAPISWSLRGSVIVPRPG